MTFRPRQRVIWTRQLDRASGAWSYYEHVPAIVVRVGARVTIRAMRRGKEQLRSVRPAALCSRLPRAWMRELSPTHPTRVQLWEAINAYAATTCSGASSVARMDAVVAIERALQTYFDAHEVVI